MIHRNRNPNGHLWNLGYGLLEVLDGLVRVASLGLLHTSLCMNYSRWGVKRHFAKLRSVKNDDLS